MNFALNFKMKLHIDKLFLFQFFVGMLSHQLKKHVIDGEKAIILNPTDAQR